MVSPSLRKSVTDLSRRKARTVFSVATLALAVASIGFFSIPSLIDHSMQAEVRAQRLADVTVTMRPLALSAAQLSALAALPNVAAVEPRNGVNTRVLIGERRAAARIFGVRDFASQSVDVVRVESGTTPGPGEVLTDVQNANVGLYDGRGGDRLTLVTGASGGASRPQPVRLAVTGEARNLPGGEEVQDERVIVLYATAETVAALSGEAGYGRLAFRLEDPRPSAAADTVTAVRRYLRTVPGFSGFDNLPEARAPGDWPGKSETEQFAELLAVITVLA